MIIVFDDGSIGVAARIGRVVVDSVVIHGPIEKLQMVVAAAGIVIEEIREVEFPDAELDSAEPAAKWLIRMALGPLKRVHC